MKLIYLPLALFALASCDVAVLLDDENRPDAPEVSCATQPASCAFDQNPLTVLPEPVTIPRRPYQFFPTADALNFVDSRGRRWTAPRRTLTDGASVPRIFVSIVGNPTTREFVNAAAVHDAYCGVGNELAPNFHNGTWQDVHKMFYDALVTGGVEIKRAKLMFAAVWLGGPRWNTRFDLDHVPTTSRQQAMRRAQRFIDGSNNSGGPSLPALINYLRFLDRGLLQQYPGDEDYRAPDPQPRETPVICLTCEEPEVQEPVDSPIDTPIDTPIDLPIDTPIDLPIDTPIDGTDE